MTITEGKKRKVLITSFYFPPTNSIAAVRIGKLAKYLPQFGWEPVVLTAREVKEYPQGLPLEMREGCVYRTPYSILASTVANKLSPGQSAVPRETSRIRFWRTIVYRLLRLVRPIYTLPLLRILALEPIGWYRHAVRKGLEILDNQKVDVIFSSYGPSVSHFVARQLHDRSGIPWVAEFRDLWSLNHNVRKVQPFHFLDKRLERKVMKHSAALITVSEPWAKKLGTLHSRKAVTIPNGFDEEDYLNDVRRTAKFTITYTGNIYPGRQDPNPLFEAVARLKEKDKVSPDNFGIRFFGGTALTTLVPAIERHHLHGIVKICGAVHFRESIRKQKESMVLLLLEWNDPREKGWYSAKVFEYLAAGRPVLAVGPSGGVVDILLRETGAGVVLARADEIEILLSEWLSDFEQSGTVTSHYNPNETVIRQYTREQQARKLAQLLEEAAGHRPI